MNVVITPSNESTVRAGDTLRCSVEDNVSPADNYTWVDSATGNVIHYEAEWTIKTCSHQSCINTADDSEMIDICVNTADGLLMLECHVTVGMKNARAEVALYLEEPETPCNTTNTTSKS